MLRPREAVRTMPSYHPPLAGRDGLRLDFNENTVGCSPRVLRTIARSWVQETCAISRARTGGSRLVADFLGLHREEVLLTNGVDEAIHLLCQTYLESRRRSADCRAHVFDVSDLHDGSRVRR